MKPASLLFFAIIDAGLAAAPDPGFAQGAVICGARDQVMDHLRSRFGESPRLVGLASETSIVEVFASDETGSWTITVTSPDGRTCLMANGRFFEALSPTGSGDPT